MRKIYAIILKDTLVRFASPLEWLFFIIMPIIFTVVIGATAGPSSDQRVKLDVVDQAQNSLSQNLINTLNNSRTVHPVVKTLQDSLAEFDQRKVSVVLIIPASFTEAAINSNRAELTLQQQPNNMNAVIAQQAIQAVLGRVSSSVDIANTTLSTAESIPGFSFSSYDARLVFYKDTLKQAQTLLQKTPNRITETYGNTADPIQWDARANASAGQLITWILVPLIGLSAMFAYERQKGTLRRLLTTPTSKAMYLGGTIIGQVFTAAVQMLILILFGIFVMKVNWGHSPAALAVMIISIALAGAALGTMVGTFVKSEAQANGLSVMLGMVLAMMGGCWYPIDLFPAAVQTAVKVIPTSWAMQGMLDIVLRGQGLSGVWLEAMVLLGFALVFFVIGIIRFKYE
jgi:ABC-2 type transport system permease protein